MALEAQEVAVRVRLIGGSAFEAEAAKVAGSTEAIGEAGAVASKHHGAVATSLDTVGGKLDTVGSKMMSFGRTLTMASVPLVALGAYSMKAANSFTQQMTLLSTQANEHRQNIGWMSTDVLNISKQFGQMPTDMARGLYAFESVGIHGKQALNDIKAAAMGSAVGLDDLANTTDAVSTVMRSKIAGAGGPVEAMSLMDRAIGMGKMHLIDLTESFKSGLIPLAQTFHLDFNSVLANIAGLSEVGTPPDQIAARMRLMLTSMESLTPAAKKAWAGIGMTDPFRFANDLAKPGHLMTAFEDMRMLLSRLTGPEQNSILAATFGRSRGMGQIAGSLGQLDNILKIYATLQGTTPETLIQHFKQTQATSAYKTKTIRAELDAELIKLGIVLNTDVLPVIARLIPPLISVVDTFGHLPKPLQDFALGLAAFTIVGGPLFMFGGAAVKGAGMMMKGVEAMVGVEGMAGLRAGIAMTTADFIALAAPVAAAVGVFELFNQKHGIFADARHTVEHAGYRTGEFLLSGLYSDFGIGGGALARDHEYDYLTGHAFKHLSPLVQGDIKTLMRLGPGAATSPILGGIEHDLMSAGFSGVGNIPGVNDAIRQAVKEGIKEGMKEGNFSVVMPNGRVLAETVNEVNRKNQNRR